MYQFGFSEKREEDEENLGFLRNRGKKGEREREKLNGSERERERLLIIQQQRKFQNYSRPSIASFDYPTTMQVPEHYLTMAGRLLY